jgi:hypothetical protein
MAVFIRLISELCGDSVPDRINRHLFHRVFLYFNPGEGKVKEIQVCPRCDRYTDPDAGTCPNCGYDFTRKNAPQNDRPVNAGLPKPPGTVSGPGSADEQTLFSSGPVRMSFIYTYLMALSPLLLVIISLFIRVVLTALIGGVSKGMPGTVSVLVPNISDIANMTGFVIAPIGVFALFACIGWAMRLTEMWTATALTLGMSALVAILVVLVTKTPSTSGNNFGILIQWTAFLIQPFSIIAAIIVIAWTETFRKSISYTITNEGVWIRGGVWKKQEHMIPHHQIGRVVLEQDFFARLFNYGTVIPHTTTRWGTETSFRGVGGTGQKDNAALGIGYAKGREEGSRHPLDCLYGIPDPKTAQQFLKDQMCRTAAREEEQVSYLKKIYDKI